MRIDKVKWITAHNCGKPKWHSFTLKREDFGSWHCLTKCALENKLLNRNCWSWYHFSQEKLPHTLIPVSASTYCGKYAILFFLGHPVYDYQHCPACPGSVIIHFQPVKLNMNVIFWWPNCATRFSNWHWQNEKLVHSSKTSLVSKSVLILILNRRQFAHEM